MLNTTPMAIVQFPSTNSTHPQGLIALGGDLEPESLLAAYRQGIFPWPMDGAPLAWFCPPKRAILETDHLHLSRSLRRLQNKNEIRFSIDQAFSTVISHCAEVPRPGQTGTWITDDIQQAYGELHRLGYAHSIEAWRDQTLVGGLYGVEVEGVFSGESMFHLESNVSKLVILFLMDYLANQKAPWMDIQVMTPHMKALGAREISRTLFLKKLADAQKQTLKLFPSRSKRE